MRSLKKVAVLTVAASGVIMAGASAASAVGAGAEGAAVGSPGVISGNTIQVPIHIPVNLCGNSINVVGLVNPTFGNTCINAN
ncbi:chaplin [Streptomyces sp. NPDC092296]|uniref:chaplin n=1 Tax=Streptomyces sp. NPDC092296 TaxID=3366012 RepID=UPI0037F10D48